MPELPDVTVYVERLEALLAGQALRGARIASPFLLRTVEPPIDAFIGVRLLRTHRLGKRIALEFAGEHFMLVHLMIAGRLHWRPPGAPLPGKVGLASLAFETGTLLLTEASTKKRAALHLVSGVAALEPFRRTGIEVLDASSEAFAAALVRENHTLKRALTDPDLFSGIGNAYSDEILHRARLSPVRLTGKLEPGEIERLYQATRETLAEWTDRLRLEAGEGFPEKVTAFRPEMAVHGKFKHPCPVCEAPVQRIAYADNECNYCARCQTDGKLLADRSLSRLMRQDWPKTLDELEQRRADARSRG